MMGLNLSRLFWLLVKKPLATIFEVLQRANQYNIIKVIVSGKCEKTQKAEA